MPDVVTTLLDPNPGDFFTWLTTEAGWSALAVAIVWLIVKWTKAELDDGKKRIIAVLTPFAGSLLGYLGLASLGEEPWTVARLIDYEFAALMVLLGSQAIYNFAVKPIAKQLEKKGVTP